MIRKTILVLVASLLLVGSIYLLYLQLFVSSKIYLRFLFGAGFCFVIALFLLWEDFIEPLFRRRGPE